MKKNNIFRFGWIVAVVSALFLSCVGEYPEIDESVNGEEPEQEEPGNGGGQPGDGGGQPGSDVTPPVQWNGGDVAVTLDFTAGWPFEEACVAESSQADAGEFYKFSYVDSDDASLSVELEFGIQKGQKSSSCTHSYSYSDKALSFDNSAGSGTPSAGGGSTYGLINIPGFEGKYLSKMVIHHNGAEYFTIAAGQNFTYNASPNAATAQDSRNPLTINFPFSGVEAAQGAPYNIRLRVAGVKISKIELYYTVALPQVQGPDLTGIHHFAHRGAWSKDNSGAWVIPENSITGIQQAALMGYEGIELDVRYTSDGKMVVMHDGSINRTMRNADYTELSATVNVASTTFEDLRTKYVLESTIPSFRRQIPTLEEMLLECRRLNIRPMLHSAIEESYKLAQQIMGDNWVCFNAGYDLIKSVRGYSNCTILWSIDSDDAAKGDVLEKLAAIGGDCGISSVDEPLYTPEFINSLRDAGYHVQSSIFSPAAKELEAIENGIDYLLTDRIKPEGSAEKGSVVDDALKNPGSGHEDFIPIKSALDLSDGLQVLAIGNSFSVDAMEYLYGVLKDAGYETVALGNMYIGGCSLEKHVTNFSADKADYTYYKNTTGTWVTTKNTAPSTALMDEKWDYIMMQQVSQNSGLAETFDPYLASLVSMVLVKCPNARLMWHMTWAYQGDSTHSGFANYGKDQMTMYNAIVNAVRTRILGDKAFEKVIPNGTAVQNMRTSFYGDKLTRDGYHMSKDVGRFLTDLTFAKALTGCSLDDITYKPSDYTYTDELISAMKDAATKACEKPYEVTASAYPSN